MPECLRSWLACLLGGFFGWLLASTALAITVTDDAGHALELAQPPQRVVSLLPSLTETVCVLDACKRLVGVDRYSNWPESVRRLPRLGGGIDPNIEAVVAARPDLVLLASSTRGADRLQALGLKVLALEPRTHADAKRVTFVIAQALGLPAAVAERSWRDIEAGVQSAAQKLTPAARRQRVYVEVSPAPYGASESSFIGETLQRLGVANILPARMGPFPKVNPEYVVRAQPDAILAGDSSREAMAMRPGWNALRALREDRLCVFPQAQSDILVRAGPRLAEGARLMVDCLNRTAREGAR